MEKINYHNRIFKGIENYDSGDLDSEVRFHYFQDGHNVWGEIKGGRIKKGMLLACVTDDNSLEMQWMYINLDGEMVSGFCYSTPEILDDGRLRIHESWVIDGEPPIEGTSVIEEIVNQ